MSLPPDFIPTTADSIERSDALLPRFRNCNNNRSHPVHNFTNNGTRERSRLSFRVSFVDWFAKMGEIPWDSWVEIPVHNGMNFTPIWRWINSKVGKGELLSRFRGCSCNMLREKDNEIKIHIALNLTIFITCYKFYPSAINNQARC